MGWGRDCLLPYGSPGPNTGREAQCQALCPTEPSLQPLFFFETGSSDVVQAHLELTSNSPASVLGFRCTLGMPPTPPPPFSFLFSLLIPSFLVKAHDPMRVGWSFYQ